MRLSRLLYGAAGVGAIVLVSLAPAANAQIANAGFDVPNGTVGTVYTSTGAGASGASAAVNWGQFNVRAGSISTLLEASTDPGGAPYMMTVRTTAQGEEIYQNFSPAPASSIISVDVFVTSGQVAAVLYDATTNTPAATVMSNAATLNSWQTLVFPAYAGNVKSITLYATGANGGAFSVDRVITLANVPEPGSLALLLGGLIPATGFVLRRRRR